MTTAGRRLGNDIDARGRLAAHAARDAVRPVVAASTGPGTRSSRLRFSLAMAAATPAVAALVALAVVRPPATTVSTRPASRAPEAGVPPPPPTIGGAIFPFETPIASGRMSDGETWALLIGGPSHDPYRPLVLDDRRAVRTVFGRVASDVVSVEVVRSSGPSSGRVPVIYGEGGPFSVVELPDGGRPLIVIGYRADGTSVRYTVPG